MMPFPSATIPFPLHSGRYEVSAGMRRFGQAHPGEPAETGHFRVDCELPRYLEDRLAVLERGPGESRCWAPGLDAEAEAQLIEALWSVLATVALEAPECVQLNEDSLSLPLLGLRMDRSRGSVDIDSPPAVGFEALQSRLLTWLRAQAPRDRLADMLAFAVQEDYALSRGPLPGGDPMSDCLEMTHVCFPSSWRPVQKVGSNFSDVHRPVVHNAPLLKAHRSLVKAMIEKGPFVRYAWGVHLDGMLCRNPVFAPQIPEPIDPSPEEAAACSWFRVERQTMMPMPHLNRGLFTIRTYTQPLTKVVTTDDRRQRLASALRSMDEAALRYKHLRQRRDPLVRWLESGVSGP